jgi:hypothetical protein
MHLALILAALDLRVISAWASAHPYEAFIALGVMLNVLNGLLPATIRTGPLGTFLHVALDRLTILTRRNAPGTLKWPIIAGSILRAVADSLNPPTPTIALPAEKQGALDVLSTRPSVAPPAPTPAEGSDVVDEDAHASIVPPAPFDPHRTQRGATSFVTAIVVVALVGLVLSVGAMLSGCPNWNRPSCGAPGAYSCVRNQPHYCATGTGELTPMGDEPCDRSGKVCVIDPDGVGNCELPADGGVR